MPIKPTEKLIFLSVVIYLPVSIFFVFWLYLVQLVYAPETWQYRTFFGANGTYALLWLLADLLPAFLFLTVKSRGKKLISRSSGAIGFYCFLGSILSTYNYLAIPGFIFLITSVITRRMSKNIHQLK